MTGRKEWKKAIQQMRKALESLPSEKERDELVKAIGEIVLVLTQLSDALVALPTAEEADRAREALDRLEFIVDTNPLLRGHSGKSAPSKTKKVRHSATAKPLPESIGQEIQSLRKAGYRVRDVLEERGYTKEVLRQILAGLGRRVPGSASRREMIDQIVAALDVERTYKGLGNPEDAGS